MRLPPSTIGHTIRGFTLTELIVTMVIIGVMATMTVGFITRPMQGYMDLSRRAELVDSAEMALRQIQRDIRRALPNSIRVDGGNAIEMLNTMDAAIYKYYPPGNNDERLAFDNTDTEFNVYDHFRNIDDEERDACEETGCYLTINGVNSTELYAESSDVRTDERVSVTITEDGDEDHMVVGSSIDLDPFGDSDPPELDDSIQGRRVYLVNGPITYLCTGGELRRYRGHGINPDFSTVATDSDLTDAGATRSLVTNHVVCEDTNFVYTPGTPQRAGLATLKITLEDEGERVTLLHQVHMVNVP